MSTRSRRSVLNSDDVSQMLQTDRENDALHAGKALASGLPRTVQKERADMKLQIDRMPARGLLSLALILSIAHVSFGYSVLAHEAIIDSTWDGSIKPLLLKRFHGLSPEQLRVAHSYAYGGAIIQDMGYYPFGSKFFTDLVHYVRSGDFIENLIFESQDANEYAFALGALAHYAADNDGHAIGVNRAVPLMYPKLRQKYGSEVTYVEGPSAHIQTEFGFDVVQLARGRYRPDAYHEFIGFHVSKEVLERAFNKTYSIEMKDIFTNLDLSIATYRRSVSTIIPEITKVAWETKKEDITRVVPEMTRDKFVYGLTRADYEKEWGNEYEKPSVVNKVTALMLRVVPKVGPFKALSFKPPTPQAEQMFLASFDATLEGYRRMLAQASGGKLDLENRDFDTGKPTRASEYRLADETYARLLDKLASNHFQNVAPELRQNILAFYADPSAPVATKEKSDEWRKTLREIDELRAVRNVGDRQTRAVSTPVPKRPRQR